MKWRGLEESIPGQQAATLREELEERKALAAQYVPDDVQQVNRQTVEQLAASGMSGGILAVGAAAPSFQLPDQDGKVVSSQEDRKSTRLNSSHPSISYAVFCLKKKINTSATEDS